MKETLCEKVTRAHFARSRKDSFCHNCIEMYASDQIARPENFSFSKIQQKYAFPRFKWHSLLPNLGSPLRWKWATENGPFPVESRVHQTWRPLLQGPDPELGMISLLGICTGEGSGLWAFWNFLSNLWSIMRCTVGWRFFSFLPSLLGINCLFGCTAWLFDGVGHLDFWQRLLLAHSYSQGFFPSWFDAFSSTRQVLLFGTPISDLKVRLVS